MEIIINQHRYQVEKKSLEDKLLALLLSKKDEAVKNLGPSGSMMTSAVKAAIVLLLKQMGFTPAPGVDTIDYSAGLLIHSLLDGLEAHPLDLTLKEVSENASQQTSAPNHA